MRVRIRNRSTPAPAQPARRRPAGPPASHTRVPTKPVSGPAVEGTPPLRAEDRARRSGGPQDRALYSCRCGSTFQAPVSASVRCPHCGEPQAW
jgi:hypothetical protein